MNIAFRLAIVALPFALATAACSAPVDDVAKSSDPIKEDAGPTPTPPKPLPEADFCKSYCEKVHGCDESIDAETCENECDNKNANSLSKYRADVIESITSCVEQKDCKTVLAHAAVSACGEEAAASVAPTAATTAACTQLATSSTKCKATFDRAECLEIGKLFDDEALATVERCAQKACTDVGACVEAAVGSSLGWIEVAQCASFGDGKAFDSSSASCDSCMSASCCGEASACAASSSCSSLIDCVAGCSTDACVNDCAYYYPSGITPANNLLSCMSDRCSASCQ